MINRKKQQSFTLIELLVVIVIIGILAGVIMISTSSSIDKANFAKAQTFSSTVQEELLSNLVSEWTFDEGNDQTINRVATNNDVKDTWGSNNGIVGGSPQIKGGDDCILGKCISLNGSTDYITLNSVTYNLNSGTTFSFWAKKNLEHNGIIFGNSGTSSYKRIIFLTNDRLYFETDTDGDYCDSYPKRDTSWHYYTISVVNNGAIFYQDGITTTSDRLVTNSSVTFDKIGAGSTTGYAFNGLLDDVKTYDLALSSSQIKQNYIAGLNSMLANGNISKIEYNERINELAYEQK